MRNVARRSDPTPLGAARVVLFLVVATNVKRNGCQLSRTRNESPFPPVSTSGRATVCCDTLS